VTVTRVDSSEVIDDRFEVTQVVGDSEDTGRDLPAMQKVGRYVLSKLLGAGGMGVVYVAYDAELDRRVALKFISPAQANSVDKDIALQRLHREALAMAKLSHPNVVPVFDVGTHEGQVFVALEYIDGVTLRKWLAQKPRTVREIVSIYLQAGRGLVAAHAAGILHRDFKPDNVVVDLDGRPRVLDFGVARYFGDPVEDTEVPTLPDDRLSSRVSTPGLVVPITTEGELIGTPAYMSPEQLRGKNADARSEQFSFAVALHEALYGVRPFAGSKILPLVTNIEANRTVPVDGKRRVPRGLRAILLRALRAKPAERFPKMADFLDALEKEIGKRAGVVALSIGLPVALAGIAALTFAARRPPVCVGADREIAASWGEPQRVAVEKALRATNSSRADEVWGLVRPVLDAYAQEWSTMRTDSCLASSRGLQSNEALDVRGACLAERQHELAETVGLLEAADAKTVDRAAAMARGLSPIAECANVAVLKAPYSEPADPEQRRKVDAMRAQLARVEALLRARQAPDAEAVAREALERARTIGSRPAQALAQFGVARALDGQGKDEEARNILVDAAVEANAVGDDDNAARMWTFLVTVVGYSLGRAQESELYAKLAASSIERVGSPDALRAELLRARANVLYAKEETDKSLPLYREALEAATRAFGAKSPTVADYQLDVATGYATLGDARGALPDYESALVEIAATEGQRSPRLGRALVGYTQLLVSLHDDDRAADAARRALATLKEGDPANLVARVELAGALLGRDVDEAKREAATAFQAIDATLDPDSSLRWTIQAVWAAELFEHHLCRDVVPYTDKVIGALAGKDVGQMTLDEIVSLKSLCLTRSGSPAEGALLVKPALTHAEAKHADSSTLFTALVAAGEAALGTKDYAAAELHLRQALGVGRSLNRPETLRADAELALARALLATNGLGDAVQAHAMADDAAEEYENVHLPAEAEEARALAK
jgi:tetratricopeptide (TPR) repeat protein/predicted Ser/Thr protein kinase